MAVLPSAFDLPPGPLLALDLGEARIGVAACDASGFTARPLDVIRRHSTRAEDFAAIARVVERERAVGVIAGLPLDREGEMGPQARWARRYGTRLAEALKVPLAFWDETGSSLDAAETLRATGSRTPIDAAAAASILNDFLETRRARQASPGQ